MHRRNFATLTLSLFPILWIPNLGFETSFTPQKVDRTAGAEQRQHATSSTILSTTAVQAAVPGTVAAENDLLPPGIMERHVNLSTGVNAQILFAKPEKITKRPPLAFVHGSFHSSWCWAEKYMPYFLELGYPVAALSLRGTGGTFAGEGVKKIKIQQHAGDIRAFVSEIPNILDTNTMPVLISHSFGGLGIMKYLEMFPKEASKLAGIIVMCSVPPSGNGRLTLRYLRRSLLDSYKITVGFAMKRCIKKASLCRDLFFGGPKMTLEDGTVEDFGVSDEDIARYQGYFARDTEAIIDIRDLLNHLPSKAAVDGIAPYQSELPPCLVIGANRDFLVDQEANEETARYFGLDVPVTIDSSHDVMLGKNWKNGADAIRDWLEENV